MIIRPGAPADAPLLPDIENSAGALFTTGRPWMRPTEVAPWVVSA